jgi:hypothetical protein
MASATDSYGLRSSDPSFSLTEVFQTNWLCNSSETVFLKQLLSALTLVFYCAILKLLRFGAAITSGSLRPGPAYLVAWLAGEGHRFFDCQ